MHIAFYMYCDAFRVEHPSYHTLAYKNYETDYHDNTAVLHSTIYYCLSYL